MIQSVLAQPLPVRCDTISQLVDECTNKELDTIFTALVHDVFGITNQIGWGLRSIQYHTHATEYELLFKFLHPHGPVFRLCYKLLADCYRKYEYQLIYLPKKVKQCIEDGNVPSFYIDKLLFDHKSRTPLALALNPFEYYMFHFAYHLVNPWLHVTCEGNPNNNWQTLYLRLAEEYLTVFLPCDGSPILPPTPYYVGQGPTRTMQIHTMARPPVRTPTLFRQSVLLKQSPTVNTLHTTTQTSPHVEIWRSELILQLCLDFWLTTSDTDNVWYHPQLWSTPPTHTLQQNISGQYISTPLWNQQLLPSGEHLRVVRFFVKHLHYFANSHIEDSGAMDELKRVILPSSQCKLYQFLRQTMQHWPLDYSFRLILETWLSYIQPWRYSDYKSGSHGDDRPTVVERRWLPFIAENLLAYTLVFQELIIRFCRIDLATPKNALMLFRVTKVFAQPNLNLLIKEAEESISEGGSRTSCSKWGGIVRTHFLELEGPGFVYQPLFSSETQAKVVNFIAQIKQTEQIAQRRVEAETSSSSESGILSWLFPSISSSEYTVDERKKVFTFLAASITNLSAIFCLDEATITHQTSVLNNTTPSTPDLNVTPNIMNLTPADMNRSLNDIKYQGDPDLHPVRSYESTFLVRLLYQAATWINCMYSFEIRELYARDDLIGGIARQLLWGPTVIYRYDKRKPGYSPRVQVTLPPRLSLRYWANQRVLVSFFVYALLGKFILGYPIVFVWFVIFFLWCVFLIFNHLISRSPKPVHWRNDVNDNSNLSF